MTVRYTRLCLCHQYGKIDISIAVASFYPCYATINNVSQFKRHQRINECSHTNSNFHRLQVSTRDVTYVPGKMPACVGNVHAVKLEVSVITLGAVGPPVSGGNSDVRLQCDEP
eukprot:COSAG05_NODE_1441_length_4880_cov_3.567245_9_plen_113_part_00